MFVYFSANNSYNNTAMDQTSLLDVTTLEIIYS